MKHAKLVKRAIALKAKIDSLGALYDELDEITLELKKSRFKSSETRSHAVFLIDNFADKNHAFRTTSIRRFELRIERKSK